MQRAGTLIGDRLVVLTGVLLGLIAQGVSAAGASAQQTAAQQLNPAIAAGQQVRPAVAAGQQVNQSVLVPQVEEPAPSPNLAAVQPAPQVAGAAVSSSVLRQLAERKLEVANVERGEVKVFAGGAAVTMRLDQLRPEMLREATLVRRTEGGVREVALSAGVLENLGTPVIATHAVELPLAISGVAADGRVLSDLRARVIDATGLLFDAGARGFIGNFFVLLVDGAQPGRRIALKEPVSVMVQAAGAIIEPLPVSLGETENPALVRIRVMDVPEPEFPVTVRAGSDDAGDTVILKRVPPRVEVTG